MDAPLSTWNWFLPHNALWVAILKGYKIGLAYLDNQNVLKRLPRSDTIHEWYCTCSNKKTLIKIVSAIGMNFLNIRSSSNVRVPHNCWTNPNIHCLSMFTGWIPFCWLKPIKLARLIHTNYRSIRSRKIHRNPRLSNCARAGRAAAICGSKVSWYLSTWNIRWWSLMVCNAAR